MVVHWLVLLHWLVLYSESLWADSSLWASQALQARTPRLWRPVAFRCRAALTALCACAAALPLQKTEPGCSAAPPAGDCRSEASSSSESGVA